MSEDKGSIQFGHQFKTKARTYQAISNDLKDVMREHETFELLHDNVMKDVYSELCRLVDLLEDAAGRELDEYRDRD